VSWGVERAQNEALLLAACRALLSVLGAVDPVRCRGHCRWVDSSTSRIAIGLVKSARKIIDATALFHRGARCSGGASGLVERGMPMQVIGYVSTITPEADAGLLNAFRQALRETGFVEGQNGAIEYRLDGIPRRSAAAIFAADLGANVMVAQAHRAALAAKPATATIPSLSGPRTTRSNKAELRSSIRPLTGIRWPTEIRAAL